MNKNLLFSYLAGTVLGMAAVLPGAAQHTAQAPAEAVGDAPRITVRLDRISERTVSDRLLGFNIVYAKNPDSLWRSGVLEKAIRDVRPGFLRYPGGTVNTYFHWEHPTGNGWEDLWDPQYDTARNRPPEEFMDIDEYMALVRRTGAEPLLGINVNSGFRWNRVEEGVQEALRLMKYCRDKGFKVKYWFMGNEPYMHDCNGGAVTPARYGEMINAFVPRMKEFDPDIKIIANWHATFRKHGRQYDELFAVAAISTSSTFTGTACGARRHGTNGSQKRPAEYFWAIRMPAKSNGSAKSRPATACRMFSWPVSNGTSVPEKNPQVPVSRPVRARSSKPK